MPTDLPSHDWIDSAKEMVGLAVKTANERIGRVLYDGAIAAVGFKDAAYVFAVARAGIPEDKLHVAVGEKSVAVFRPADPHFKLTHVVHQRFYATHIAASLQQFSFAPTA
jgi:hypothetical protein